MKFEKLSESKLKVILSTVDMLRWNMSFDRLLSKDEDANQIFFEIISKAEIATGMKFDNCKLIFEGIKDDRDAFVLFITKQSVNYGEQNRYKVKNKQKKYFKNKSLFFIFNEINDFITFAKSNLFYCFLFDGKNALYRIENFLILELILNDETKIFEKSFCDRISEYSIQKKMSGLYLSYLREHGKAIIKDSALKTVYYKF